MRLRLPLHALLELAALALLAASAWWLGGRATDAWLVRVSELGVTAPDADAVRSQARRAALLYSLGVGAVAAARLVVYRRSRDPIAAFWLLPAALGAALLGLVIQLSTVELARGVAAMPTGTAFAQGILLGCLAGGAILIVPRDPGELASRAQYAIALAIVACFAALAVVGSGPAGTGTRINLGPIQPLEIVKPMAVLFLAAFLGARASKLRWQRRRVLGLRWPRLELLLPAVGILLAIFAGLYVIGDLGPVLLLALGFLGMFYLASRATGWAVLALALVLLAFALLAWKPELAGGGTVQTRLRMWRDPWTNAMSNGHQLGEGLWALAAGHTSGQGLAYAATPIVPAGKTDLVLATMTEQLGAPWLVVYQLLMASLVFGGLHVATRGRTAERTLIAAGAALLLLVQWIVIHAGTFGHLPLTGIVVPFLSSGKSSMVAFVAVVALIVRLSDSQPREVTTELAELHGAVRGFSLLAAVALAYAVISGLYVTVIDRHAIAARTILVRLADGTLVERQNPRLLAIASQIRRGSILDRNGTALAVDGPERREYPLGSALGGLLGVHPTKVLLPTWAAERTFERRLRGYDDLAPFAPLLDLDRTARAAKIAELDAAVAARSVTLSIDARLQEKVAAALGGKHLAAAAVVLDADTGHVLARAQRPDWNPNDPSWQARVLANDRTFLATFHGTYGAWPDKTGLQGMFQSGSVGKIFTALAAVRSNLADRRYRCVDSDAQGPFFTRPGWTRPIHDHHNDRTHGVIDLVGAIAVSCNVYFGQLGLELGAEPLVALRAAGVEAGFGAKLTPGAEGSRQLASTAFGQGAMVMSPLQAARLVAAVANGGRYLRCAPSMELGAPCNATPLVDTPEALAPVVAGMRRVMTGGTGSALQTPAGVRAYAKTGTADVRGFVGEEPFGIRPGAEARPHSWFVVFAEDVARPENAVTSPGRIAVAVVVPRGGTGASAAGPIAMQILAAAKELGYLGEPVAPMPKRK